jgi:hypothetical protein
MNGGIRVTGRQERRSKQLLDVLRKSEDTVNLKRKLAFCEKFAL